MESSRHCTPNDFPHDPFKGTYEDDEGEDAPAGTTTPCDEDEDEDQDPNSTIQEQINLGPTSCLLNPAWQDPPHGNGQQLPLHMSHTNSAPPVCWSSSNMGLFQGSHSSDMAPPYTYPSGQSQPAVPPQHISQFSI